MNVFLVDGTYELFRHFYAVPPAKDVDGREVGAVRGVLGSVLSMLEDDVTHIGVATDHVIESFRNDLWPGYKTGEGVDPALLGQFGLLEEGLDALGVAVWPMTDLEADDGLASAAARAAADPRVEQVFICTPDKDLAQCVTGTRVVQFDRRAGALRDEEGVRAKFGVAPASIPDYLALVGDAADGFPGLKGWGAKSAAAVVGRYGRLDAIPDDPADWDVAVQRGGPPRGRARRPPRPRPAVPRPRHPAHRRAAVRVGGRPPLERAETRFPSTSARGSTSPATSSASRPSPGSSRSLRRRTVQVPAPFHGEGASQAGPRTG